MIGEIAALTTAFLWSCGSIFFTSAARQIGPLNVNRIRLAMAVLLLGTTLLITKGWILQPGASFNNYFYLGLSGIIGLALGDSFLFSAMVMIGTRLTMLVYSLAPAIAAIFAWLYLGETLNPMAILGISVTLGGIIWVTAEKSNGGNEHPARLSGLGIFYAFLGGVGQAVGLVFAKKGMGDLIDPLAGTFIRMFVAAALIWLICLVSGSFLKTLRSLRNRRGVLLSVGGACCGPFLGVWMSLVSVKHTQAGIAMAIMSIVPILVIPWVMIFYKERVSKRAVLGAILAVVGVFLLFLA